MSSFLDLGFFFVHNNPETEDQAALNYKTERAHATCTMHIFRIVFFQESEALGQGDTFWTSLREKENKK